MRWIKCSTRLPAVGQDVILAFKRPYARKGEVAPANLDINVCDEYEWALVNEWPSIIPFDRASMWMPTSGGKWSPGCSPGAWEPLDSKAKFCPGCGHPVQVKQPQDVEEDPRG